MSTSEMELTVDTNIVIPTSTGGPAMCASLVSGRVFPFNIRCIVCSEQRHTFMGMVVYK